MSQRAHQSVVQERNSQHEALPAACATASTFTDEPPHELRSLHQPAFVARWLQHIRDRIASPVLVRHAGGCRFVCMLGQTLLKFSPDGAITPFLLEIEPRAYWQEVPASRINLGGMPFRWLWLDAFRQRFEVRLKRRLRTDDPLIPQYSHWFFDHVRARIERDGSLPVMRQRIAEALDLDMDALAIARRLEPRHNPRVSVLISSYCEVVAHRADYDKLARECPTLIPLFALLRTQLDSRGEPAQRLRDKVVGVRVSRATWRAVHNGDGRLFDLLAEFYVRRNAESALDLLRVVETLKPAAQPPRWFLRTLLHFYGHAGQRRDSYSAEVHEHATSLRRLLALATQREAALADDKGQTLHRVLTWMQDDPTARRNAFLSKASWNWYARRADAWDLAQRHKALSSDDNWDAPFAHIDVDGYSVLAMRSAYDLWNEGRAMRHCAAVLKADCRRGTWLVFSIRHPARNRPIASLRARWALEWKLDQVVGFANRQVTPSIQLVAKRVVDVVNAQGWKPLRSQAGVVPA